MPESLAILCKSWLPDLLRVQRLMASIQRFNEDSIPVYLLVSRDHLANFTEELSGLNVTILEEEAVLDAARHPVGKNPHQLPGNLRQQCVKTEAWRLKLADNLLVVDSDSYFIRPFRRHCFLSPDGHPYSVMHEAHDILDFAARTGNCSLIRDYHTERDKARALFGREGLNYDFGPTPVVWSARVWEALHTHFAEPRQMGFADLLELMPTELLWYGESLLAYAPIPLHPREPLFKVFHTHQQWEESRSLGEDETVLARNYLGIVAQSNWDERMDREPRKRRRARHLWLKKS